MISATRCLCMYILLHANASGLQQQYKDVVHMAVVCLVISSLHALVNHCKAAHAHQASHKAAYSVLFKKAGAGPRWVCTFPLASVNLMILGLRSSCCSSTTGIARFADVLTSPKLQATCDARMLEQWYCHALQHDIQVSWTCCRTVSTT